MDMEMSSGAVPKLEHPPAREARRCWVLLVVGLVALPLLAFFVVGQESATTVWEMASAKFTGAMNDAAGNATSGRADELLGGLLAPGMMESSPQSHSHSCRTEVEDKQCTCTTMATNAPAALRPVCWHFD